MEKRRADRKRNRSKRRGVHIKDKQRNKKDAKRSKKSNSSIRYTDIKYNDLVDIAKPLDLLLFRGDDLVSNVILELQENANGEGSFSHAGLIVTSECMPFVEELKNGRLYVWESTMSMSLGGITDGVPDVESGHGKLGVQIRDLEDVVCSYTKDDAYVAWCRLVPNPWNERSPGHIDNVIENMRSCHKDYGSKMYEINPLSLLASIIPCLRPFRNALEKDEDQLEQDYVFCSELVALVYRRMGILDDKIDPSNVVPMDFLGKDVDGMPIMVEDPLRITPTKKKC